MSSQEPLNLDQLVETYEVIGELSGSSGAARRLLAKRRADDADVFITVAQTPPGDEGNALSHLAADATLLCGRVHRNLLPVLEGRWLGGDAFSVVTERVNAPSMEELLARRDEEFDFPRIATILQDVNGVLEWARAQKVVHRGIDLNTLYLEPGSDRVLVSFVVRPLQLTEMPGAGEDAGTIALLARAMLTRSSAAPERDNLPLVELRPGLPTKVIEQTEALLAPPRAIDKIPDVRGYIAAIAMADVLKRGETECDEKVRKLVEEERVAREDIEARRQECERIASEHERALQVERETFAKEKEAIVRALADDREKLEQERASLAALSAELERQHDLYARTTEHVTPAHDHPPVVVPLSRTTRKKKRAWNAPVAATGLLLIIAMSLLALGRRGGFTGDVEERGVNVSRVEQTAPGNVATEQPLSLAPLTPVPTDLVSGVAARAALAPLVPRRQRPRPLPTVVDSPRVPTAQPDSTVRADTLRALPTVAPILPVVPGVPVILDSLRRPRPDSAKRDSIRRDTLVRRDTLR